MAWDSSSRSEATESEDGEDPRGGFRIAEAKAKAPAAGKAKGGSKGKAKAMAKPSSGPSGSAAGPVGVPPKAPPLPLPDPPPAPPIAPPSPLVAGGGDTEDEDEIFFAGPSSSKAAPPARAKARGRGGKGRARGVAREARHYIDAIGNVGQASFYDYMKPDGGQYGNWRFKCNQPCQCERTRGLAPHRLDAAG